MAVLIDSSILIEAERGRLDLSSHVEAQADVECFVSVVTASEMLHGVHRAAQPDRRARRSAFVEGVLERFPMLEVDVATARAHAGIWAELAAGGSLIGPHDLWLAATCIAHGLALVTANVRDFERVPGLRIQVWEDVTL